jgi:photosystem II stability/assembly factor-like uncharacterized protein/DNA-binding beta-propeller fold protein YncE
VKKQLFPVKLFSVFVVCSIALALFNRPVISAPQPNLFPHLPPPGGSAFSLPPSIDIPAIVDELDLGVPAGNGHRPQRVAVDSQRRQLYTLNEGLSELNEGNTVSVIDLNTNEVTALIQLDNLIPSSPLQPTTTRPSPLDLQIDPYRPRLYALTGDLYADPPFNKLSIIDLDTFTLIDTVAGVNAIAPGPDRLYLAGATRLWAADPTTLAELAYTDLQPPASIPQRFLLLNAAANRLYLGQRQPELLAAYAADSLTPVGSYSGLAQLGEAVVDEAGQRVWLIDSDGTQLTLRALNSDAQPLTTPAPFLLTDDTYSDPHLALAGSDLAVTNRTIDAYQLQLFNRTNLAQVASLTIPGYPTNLAADPAAGRLYATYSDAASYILDIDPATGAAETIFTARLLKDALADPHAGRLYVLNDERTLQVLNLADYSEIARLDLEPKLNCKDPSGCLSPDRMVEPALALDPGRQRLYLSGDPAQVIDTATLTLAATLDTPGQLTPDPTSDRLYLTTPCQCRTTQCNTIILSANTLTGTATLFPPLDPLAAPCVINTTLDPQNQRLYALIFNGVAGSNSGNSFSAFTVAGPPKLIYDTGQIGYYGEFALDPGRQRAFIARGRLDRSFIERFQAQGQTLTSTLELAGANGLLMYDPPFDRLYAVNEQALQVFDGSLALLSEIALPGNFRPFTLDSQAQRLYLGGSNGNLLVVAAIGGQLESPPQNTQPISATPPQLFTAPDGSYFRLDNGQLYRSDGQNWQLLGRGLPNRQVRAFAISPNYPEDRTMLAGLSAQGRNGGLYRSTDRGDTWQPTTHGLTDLDINQVVFSPTFAQDQTAFLSTSYRGLFRSNDGGDTWQSLAGGYADYPGGDSQLSHLAVSPTFAQDKLVIISARTLLRSSDGGDTWTDTGLPPGKVAFSPDFARDRLVLSAGRWRSADGGQSWQPVAAGLEPNQGVQSLFFSPTFAADQTVYLLLNQNYDQPLKLQRSVDAGRTWQSLLGGLPANFDLATAAVLPSGELYLSNKTGQQPFVIAPSTLTWGRPTPDPAKLDLQALAIAPDGSIFVANSTAGVLKSTDEGRTWQDTSFPARADETKVAQLAVANNGALFVAVGTIIERSPNGGQSWTYLTKLPPGFEVKALAVSPNFAPDGIVLVGGNYASRQILRSADGGQTWQVVFDGAALEGASDVGAIAISPNFARDKTAYAWLQYAGLLRSTDAGQSWTLLPGDKNNAFAQMLAVGPDGRLYLGELYGGLSVSDDGGQSWQNLTANIPDQRTWSSALAFGPDNSLFLGTDIGVYRSLDGGQTWTSGSEGLPLDPDQGTPQAVRALAVSDQRLYAALTEGGLFVSDDQGQSWRSAQSGP